MADYQVQVGEVGIHAKRLVANTVETITFLGVYLPDVEVLSDGLADIYVTFGSDSTPTIAGRDCWRIPAFPGSTTLPARLARRDSSALTIVKLISSGTPLYSVARSR